MYHFIFFFILFLFIGGSSAGLKDTEAYINQLLKSGRKVAVLLIDMQEGLSRSMVSWELAEVQEDQVALLNFYADNPQVEFVDINLSGEGETLVSLQAALNKKNAYKLFTKTTIDSFKSASVKSSGKLAETVHGELSETLAQKGVSDVLVMGCYDGSCVVSTARGAEEAGFNVFYDRQLNITLNPNSRYGNVRVPYEQQRKSADEFWESVKRSHPNIKEVPPRYNLLLGGHVGVIGNWVRSTSAKL